MKGSFILVFVALLLVGGRVLAQEGGEGRIWKRKVKHIVFVNYEYGEKKKEKKKSILFEKILAQAQRGEIKLFSPENIEERDYFNKILTSNEIDSIQHSYAINLEEIKSYSPEFVFAYKILEDWTFDRYKGEMKRQIIGIAPVQTILNDDGSIRAYISICWIKYEDIIEFLKKYDHTNPQNSLLSNIWDDSFTKINNRNIKKNEKEWSETTSRLLLFPNDISEFDVTYTNAYNDTPLCPRLISAINAKQLVAYSPTDSLFMNSMTHSQLTEKLKISVPDTVFVKDNFDTVSKIKDFDVTDNYKNYNTYKILEKREYDIDKGTISFQLLGISPCGVYSHDSYEIEMNYYSWKPLFWLKYSDIQNILQWHELYHRCASFYNIVWDSYLQLLDRSRRVRDEEKECRQAHIKDYKTLLKRNAKYRREHPDNE